MDEILTGIFNKLHSLDIMMSRVERVVVYQRERLGPPICESIVDRVFREHQESEKRRAVDLATTVLDRVNADPDDDLAVLARQFLRVLEGLGEYQPPVGEG